MPAPSAVEIAVLIERRECQPSDSDVYPKRGGNLLRRQIIEAETE